MLSLQWHVVFLLPCSITVYINIVWCYCFVALPFFYEELLIYIIFSRINLVGQCIRKDNLRKIIFIRSIYKIKAELSQFENIIHSWECPFKYATFCEKFCIFYAYPHEDYECFSPVSTCTWVTCTEKRWCDTRTGTSSTAKGMNIHTHAWIRQAIHHGGGFSGNLSLNLVLNGQCEEILFLNLFSNKASSPRPLKTGLDKFLFLLIRRSRCRCRKQECDIDTNKSSSSFICSHNKDITCGPRVFF